MLRNLKRVMKEKGFTRRDLERETGISYQQLTKYIHCQVVPRPDKIELIAHALNVDVIELIADRYTPTQKIPIISWVSAGRVKEVENDISLLEETTSFISADDLDGDNIFALRVDGDSMNRCALPGSIVIVDPNKQYLIDRKLYIFSNADGALFKMYRASPPRLEPYSYNAEHEAIYPNEENNYNVVGQVVRIVYNTA